jgi:N6-adenosine-specific RNA methylase IME4
MRYDVILADPPRNYKDKCHAGKRGACYKYKTMDLAAILALPVGTIAKPDCALFLWTTMPMLPDALKVIQAWGFSYKTVAFNWVKIYPKATNCFLAWATGRELMQNFVCWRQEASPRELTLGLHKQ